MLIYRTMLRDSVDGRPVVGSRARMLGVRVPEDVQPDAEGFVHPMGGGMSVVAEDPLDMPPWLIPSEHGGTSRKGQIYQTSDATILPPLALQTDGAPHHLIEPSTSLQLDRFQAALAATRPHWTTWP